MGACCSLLIQTKPSQSDLVKEEKGSMKVEIQDLPQDIITDILSRLPVKFLLRFRCICKSWHALIRHSSFIETHLYRAVESSIISLIFTHDWTNLYCIDYDVCNGDEEVTMLDISFLGGEFSSFGVLGSCNGILCVNDDKNTTILLRNPSTREYKQIPSFQQRVRGSDRFHYLGLCYHRTTKTYKVTGIQNYVGNRNYPLKRSEVMMYTLGGGGGSWRSLGKVPWFTDFHCPAKLVGGTLYWMAKRIEGNQCIIVSFDVGMEDFQEIELPSNVDGDSTDVDLWKGAHALFHPLSNCNIEIWTLKDYGVKESWIKQLVFQKPKNADESRFSCLKNGEILLREKFGGNHIVYDPEKDKATEAITKLGPAGYITFDIYVSSLVSPPDAKDGIAEQQA